MSEYLLDEIIQVTKDDKSENFWKKAIKELGANTVEMELGELKHQIRVREIENPAKYLTTLLKKQMNARIKIQNTKPTKQAETLKTYFETTQWPL